MNYKLIILVLSTILVQWGFADESMAGNVTVLPSIVYAPTGFDSNDNAQLLIEGQYPNTCYKAGKLDFHVDEASKKIVIKNTASVSNKICLMVIVPYHYQINLGQLSAGLYNVYVLNENQEPKKMAILPVSQAKTDQTDELLYLPITEAFLIKKSPQDAHFTLTLRGILTNSCMKIKSIKLVQKTASVVEVLPIAEMGTDNCVVIRQLFEVETTVKLPLVDRTLFHIRSLNGNAINLFYDE